MFNSQNVAGLPTAVCWQEYQRAIPFLKDTLMETPKHPNVGTIGQVEHAQSTLSASITGAATPMSGPNQWLSKHQQPLNAMNATVAELIEDAVLNGKDFYVVKMSPVV